MDERMICQTCKNRKDKKCKVTGKFVARKKFCDTNQYKRKGE